MLGVRVRGSSEVFCSSGHPPTPPRWAKTNITLAGESGAKSSRQFSGAEKTCVFALKLLLSD